MSIAVNSARLQSLLAYLVLHRHTPQSRQQIAEQLWPVLPHAEALTTLDDCVQELAARLPAVKQFLHRDRQSVWWDSNRALVLDVDAFEGALHHVDHVVNVASMRSALVEAVDRYAGDFLPDCQDAWVQAKREQLRRRFTEGLDRLVQILEDQRQYGAAVPHARRLRELDERRAITFRRLVHMHVLSGERAAILPRLERRLQASVQGQGALVLIRGVAGIGKTSLAQVCAAWAQRMGAVFAVGRCHEGGVTPPFSPWQEAMVRLAQSTGAVLESLPEPFGRGDTAQSAHQLFQAVSAHLHASAAAQPLVLLLDDLHWADQDSLDLLEYITRQIERTPLLILTTYRSEEIHRTHSLHSFLPALQRNRPVEVIHLMPLELDGTTRLIEGRLGLCSTRLARYLHDRAEGHPLFLVELLNDLIERDLLAQDAQGFWLPPDQEMPMPALLRQVIAQRVARLGAQAEEFLEVAAVRGEMWELSLVESILGWPENALLAALEQTLAARVVETVDEAQERYRFSHGLFRHVLYRRQLPRRRKHLHARMAVLLESSVLTKPSLAANAFDDQLSALADHTYQAEQWDKAHQYGLEAGDNAHRVYANHSALQFYRQALDAIQRSSEPITHAELVCLYEKLGGCYTVLNHKDETVDAYQQMVQEARGAEDKAAEARALFQLAVAQENGDQLGTADATRQAALQLAETLEDPHVRALRDLYVGRNYLVTGEPEQALRHFEQSEGHARMMNDPALLAKRLRYQGYLTVFAGRYAEAERLGSEGVEIAQAARDIVSQVSFIWVIGIARVEIGRYGEARQILQEGLSQAGTLGEDHYYIARLLNTLGYLYNEVGNLDAAMQWNRRALEINQSAAAAHQPVHALSYTLLDLATNQLHRGRLDAARAYLHQLESMQNDSYSGEFRYLNRAQLLQAELALAHNDYDCALEQITEATPLARAHNMPKNVAKCLLYQGEALLGLGRSEEAVLRLQEAMAIADQIVHGSLRWKTRLRLAKAHTVLGRPTTELYRQALAQIDTIVDALHDQHMRASFLGAPLVIELKANARSALKPLPDAPSPPADLSDREVEVLQLVAQGYTDRQIGAELHVSARTVNAHVTNILNKTACPNRTAAATFAVRHGLL